MTADPITTDVMLQELEQLDEAYPRGIKPKNPGMRISIYRDGLRGVTAAALREAVRRVIQEDVYFPKAARLREVARTVDREIIARNPRKDSWEECGLCGAQVTRHDIFYDTKDPETGIVAPKWAGRRFTMTHLDNGGHSLRREGDVA